jgi:hypothetical protein
MVTVWVHESEFPDRSAAVHATILVPMGKTAGASLESVTVPELSEDRGTDSDRRQRASEAMRTSAGHSILEVSHTTVTDSIHVGIAGGVVHAK